MKALLPVTIALLMIPIKAQAPKAHPIAPFTKQKRQNTKNTVDDYNDFDSSGIKNRDQNALKAVTYIPVTQAYDIPELSTSSASTLSPLASNRPFSVNRNTQLYTWNQPQRRKGYFFMHYPWNLLPKPYRLRPSYQFIYPQQYQNTVYSYPSNPYSDPYGVYRHLVPCGSPGGFCGYNVPNYGGCGNSGCGSGCASGGCDTDGFSGDNEEEDEETGNDEKSGEAQVNKTDPLDDLDLEDLEKLDKDKDEEADEKKKRKVMKQ